MARSKITLSERVACWKVIREELDILDAQSELIAEALRLLGRQPAIEKDQATQAAANTHSPSRSYDDQQYSFLP